MKGDKRINNRIYIIASLFFLCFLLLLTVTLHKGRTPEQKLEEYIHQSDVKKIEIKIKGVKNTKQLLYITDNQTNFDDREDLGWFGTKEARTFRNEKGEASATHLEDWIQYANAKKVDALVFGGDTLDYFTEKNISELKRILGKLKVPYLYTYGNHDSYIPWENRFDDTNKEFVQLFRDDNIEFQVMDMDEFYIIDIRNYQNNGTAQVSKEAVESYKKYAKEGKPIILVCHVPICTKQATDLLEFVNEKTGSTYVQYDAGDMGTVNKAVLLGENMGYDLEESTKEFLDEITKEDSPVVAILSGHTHMQWEGKITDHIYEYIGAGAFEDSATMITISGE